MLYLCKLDIFTFLKEECVIDVIRLSRYNYCKQIKPYMQRLEAAKSHFNKEDTSIPHFNVNVEDKHIS